MKRLLKPIVLLVLVVVIFLGLGFRLNHLQGGLSSALGSAKSSLALYKHSKDVAVGKKIVVNVKGVGPQLGIVKSKTDQTADVDFGSTFIRVENSEVLGNLIAVVPFFGSILNIVGL